MGSRDEQEEQQVVGKAEGRQGIREEGREGRVEGEEQ